MLLDWSHLQRRLAFNHFSTLTTFPILEFQNCFIILPAELLHGSCPGFPFLEMSPFIGPSYKMAQGLKQTLLTLLYHWWDFGMLFFFFLFIMIFRNCLLKAANLPFFLYKFAVVAFQKQWDGPSPSDFVLCFFCEDRLVDDRNNSCDNINTYWVLSAVGFIGFSLSTVYCDSIL